MRSIQLSVACNAECQTFKPSKVKSRSQTEELFPTPQFLPTHKLPSAPVRESSNNERNDRAREKKKYWITIEGSSVNKYTKLIWSGSEKRSKKNASFANVTIMFMWIKTKQHACANPSSGPSIVSEIKPRWSYSVNIHPQQLRPDGKEALHMQKQC